MKRFGFFLLLLFSCSEDDSNRCQIKVDDVVMTITSMNGKPVKVQMPGYKLAYSYKNNKVIINWSNGNVITCDFENGKLVKRIEVNSNGNLDFGQILTYNANGQLISVDQFEGNNPHSYIYYSYSDLSNNPTSINFGGHIIRYEYLELPNEFYRFMYFLNYNISPEYIADKAVSKIITSNGETLIKYMPGKVMEGSTNYEFNCF